MSKGPYLRKYGVQTTILFDLFEVDGVDLRVDAVHVAGDTKIMKDEGVEANTTNGFTDEGQGYSIVLSATEMQAARIKVYIVDTATKVWLDTSITIETYGHASAMHAFDLDVAIQDVNVASSDDIGLTAAQKADVNTEADTALSDIHLDHLLAVATGIPALTAGTYLDQLLDDGTATYDRTTDSLQAIRDRGDAAWTTGAGGTPPQLLQSTTIATLASQTSFTLTAGSADDDAYNGAVAVVTDSVTSTQKAVGFVLDYVGSTKTLTLASDPGVFTMAVGDTIEIIAVVPLVEIAKEVWDRIISKANHNIGQSAGKILRQGGDIVQIDGSVSDATPSITNFDTNLTQVDSYFDDAVLVFSNGSANAGIGRPVSAYLNANGNMTFAAPDDWPVTPVNGDDFVIYATHVHPVAQIADAVHDEDLSGHTTAGTAGKALSDVEVELTDSHTQVGQAAPPSAATFRQMLQYLYKAWRNRSTQTDSQYTLYNDDAATVDQKAVVSDDDTTFDRKEVGSGP